MALLKGIQTFHRTIYSEDAIPISIVIFSIFQKVFNDYDRHQRLIIKCLLFLKVCSVVHLRLIFHFQQNQKCFQDGNRFIYESVLRLFLVQKGNNGLYLPIWRLLETKKQRWIDQTLWLIECIKHSTGQTEMLFASTFKKQILILLLQYLSVTKTIKISYRLGFLNWYWKGCSLSRTSFWIHQSSRTSRSSIHHTIKLSNRQTTSITFIWFEHTWAHLQSLFRERRGLYHLR